jgi:7-cyano-7-deazaguanine reductase
MDISEFGNTLRAGAQKPETVARSVLVALDYGYKATRGIEVEIEQPEFTSLCPITGLPDYGTIQFCYVPNEKIVELKSLKYYLLQFRDVGIFYEHVVNRILDDFVAVISPKRAEIVGTFTARGGITTKVRATYTDEDPAKV